MMMVIITIIITNIHLFTNLYVGGLPPTTVPVTHDSLIKLSVAAILCVGIVVCVRVAMIIQIDVTPICKNTKYNYYPILHNLY